MPIMRDIKTIESLKDSIEHQWRVEVGERVAEDGQSWQDVVAPEAYNGVYVNVYEIGQGYGGPEEGGWWFNTGSPVSSVQVRTVDQAVQVAQLFAELYGVGREDWQGCREYTSAAGGTDYTITVEMNYAKPYPEERPFYC